MKEEVEDEEKEEIPCLIPGLCLKYSYTVLTNKTAEDSECLSDRRILIVFRRV